MQILKTLYNNELEKFKNNFSKMENEHNKNVVKDFLNTFSITEHLDKYCIEDFNNRDTRLTNMIINDIYEDFKDFLQKLNIRRLVFMDINEFWIGDYYYFYDILLIKIQEYNESYDNGYDSIENFKCNILIQEIINHGSIDEVLEKWVRV
jgi:hypothetical protein